MSGLRERLNRLKKPEAEKQSAPAMGAGEDWSMIGAHLETSEWGAFILRRRVYSLDSYHGKHRLGDLTDVVQELSSFHPSAEVRLEGLLFFDTETTGLGVGAGNVPFMVGIGYYADDQFVVEQLFMRNPGEEMAMLKYLQHKLDASTHIVSYNGRTFDWPILKNRYVLNRLKLNESSLLQLDLLYASRSLWRKTLPSCRLSTVEVDRLGFARVNDVPGSMAPTLYFHYLAEKDIRAVAGLFLHNEHDIVSLAALAIHFAKILGGMNPIDSKIEDRLVDNEGECTGLSDEEALRTALWLEKMGRPQLAEAAMERLWSRLLNHTALTGRLGELTMELAAYFKKKGVYRRAADIWLRLSENRSSGIATNIEPLIELAMFYEHREKNLEQALLHTEEAWTRLWRRRSLSRSDRKQSEMEEAVERRMERLRLKLQHKCTKASTGSQVTAGSFTRTREREAGGVSVSGSVMTRKPRRVKPDYVRESLL
jgi:uncharacterized protein YprB with RNaseH-like and TPR domain